MISLIYLLQLIAIASTSSPEEKESVKETNSTFTPNELGVYELGDDTVDQFLQENMFVLVRFCKGGDILHSVHAMCKIDYMEYLRVRKEVFSKYPHIKIAEIDIDKNEFSRTRYIVDTYPFYILFVREIPIEYNEEIESDSMIKFISEKTVINRFPAESEEDIYNALNNPKKGTAIFYGEDDSEECDEFYLVQLPYSEIDYMNFNDHEIAEKYGFNDTHRMAIFIDGKKKFYGGPHNFFAFGEFVERNMFKDVEKLSLSTLDHLVDRTRFNGSLIVYITNGKMVNDTEKMLKEVSILFSDINYSYSYFINMDEVQSFIRNYYPKINDFFAPPNAFAFEYPDLEGGTGFSIMHKFPSVENLTEFMHNHLAKKGNYTYFQLGNSKPKISNDSDVVDIDLKEMDFLMSTPETDFLILFYNSTHKNYERILNSLVKLGEALRALNSSLQLYKMDGSMSTEENLIANNSHSLWVVNKEKKKPELVTFSPPFDPNVLAKVIKEIVSEKLEFPIIDFLFDDSDFEDDDNDQDENDSEEEKKEENDTGKEKIEL